MRSWAWGWTAWVVWGSLSLPELFSRCETVSLTLWFRESQARARFAWLEK